ncbi:hypothetical protein JHL18_02030 [Clostridium sp. YIM B02505]|uniref:Uncharacterized protein n=1 Tax=Clostridium yunnanense TaxID=2800325 RepID=A0ABS1EJ84_9CLOT|nr:hypothetical protein [Clostridium yunnanense]MBK1809426.1 hypothetical protein [Clostridium yunnanense]
MSNNKSFNNQKNNEIIDVEPISEELKVIDPSKDLGNYLIQVLSEDGSTIIKQLITNKCTVRISNLGDQSTVAEIK